MRIFIGHDERQAINSKACAESIKRFGYTPEFINLKSMRKIGYHRVEDGSTEFAYSRFLVPYLCGYKGYALFCDSDFIWRSSPSSLETYLCDLPVHCVKHQELEVRSDIKFRGNKNEWYPKKWWSSLMLFNCSHPDIVHNLTLENINNQAPQWLHRFEWADKVGNLPVSYNHLVGYYEYDPKAVAVHFTDGSPMYNEYKKDDYADEWLKFAGF